MHTRLDAIEAIVGLGLIVLGVGAYSWPAASIVAGLALVLTACGWTRRG